jgi:hypothetical protein
MAMEPNVLSLYTADTEVGMQHPLWMARTQSLIDAEISYCGGVPLDEALATIPDRIRFLFGDDIPVALVTATVSLAYARFAAQSEAR